MLVADVNGAGLLADGGPFGRVQQAISRIFEDGFGGGFQSHVPAADPIDGTFRLVEGFGASLIRALYGAALVPLGLLSVPAALLDGEDPAAALENFITQTVDGPSWAVNPILFALRDTLIEPLGGAGGVFADLQNQLQSTSKQLGNTIVSLLGLLPVRTMAATDVGSGLLGAVDPFSRAQRAIEYIIGSGVGSGFEEYAGANGVVDGFFRLGEGFGAAAVRTASSAVLLPLGLLEVVGSPVGDERDPGVALARFITQTVDCPSWAVNPVLFALRDALIEPLSGSQGVFADAQNQLQLTSKEVGAAIVSALGLDTAEASDASSRQAAARNGIPGPQNASGQVEVMRFAQSGPTAVPGTGQTLDFGSGPGSEGPANGTPDEQKLKDRELKGADAGDARQPKLTDLRSEWQQDHAERQQQRAEQRAERQQQRAEQRAERQQQRKDAHAERQQQRQSKVKSEDSPKNAE